jgi:RNA polymerase sigma-70 factor (ECF subfamily)
MTVSAGARAPVPTPIDAPMDQSLIDAACAGDDEAFSEIVRRYTPRLFQFVCAMGNAAADADDILQQAFIRAHAKLDRYDPSYAFSTWLFTIARRIAINHHGRRRQDAPLKLGVPIDEAALGTAREPVEESIWRIAHAHLAPRLYQVLWLHYGEDLDMAGVGQVLGITGLHARVLAHRARAQLSKIVQSQSASPCPSPG